MLPTVEAPLETADGLWSVFCAEVEELVELPDAFFSADF
jgi:hypothetical protein